MKDLLKRSVVVVDGSRIPFVRSFGEYLGVPNKDLLLAAVKPLIQRLNLRDEEVGEFIFGAVMKHPRDWNLSREVALASGVKKSTPGMDIQRACGTSLEAAIIAAQKIALGVYPDAIVGGVDSNSLVPITLRDQMVKKLLKLRQAKSLTERLKLAVQFSFADFIPDFPSVMEPTTGLSMGEHAELMAKEWAISREEQDELALASHLKAAQAVTRGYFSDAIAPYLGVNKDTIVRGDSSREKLAKLKPVFDRQNGTLTAGNSTALSDGAACVYLADSEYAEKRGLKPLARLTYFDSAAVGFHGQDPLKDGLLMAPTKAVAKMLKRSGLQLQDFDFYEIHEAFAAQVLCTLKAWESDSYCRTHLELPQALGAIDRSKLNQLGSSLAYGHPFAATGARLLHTLAMQLSERGSGRGLISICTAGGMGVTAILEKV